MHIKNNDGYQKIINLFFNSLPLFCTIFMNNLSVNNQVECLHGIKSLSANFLNIIMTDIVKIYGSTGVKIATKCFSFFFSVQ